LLGELFFVPGIPSLRGLLTDTNIIKVVHHGSNDGLVLRSYGIAISPVFDTAVADALLCKGDVVACSLGLAAQGVSPSLSGAPGDSSAWPTPV
jgi:hypothetical protein